MDLFWFAVKTLVCCKDVGIIEVGFMEVGRIFVVVVVPTRNIQTNNVFSLTHFNIYVVWT